MQRLMIFAVVALLVAVTVTRDLAGPRLHIALEDRGDPRPRQVVIDARIAGLCLAFIVSWTQRAAR